MAISGGFANNDYDDYCDYDVDEHDSHVCPDCSIVYRLTVPSHLPQRSTEKRLPLRLGSPVTINGDSAYQSNLQDDGMGFGQESRGQLSGLMWSLQTFLN